MAETVLDRSMQELLDEYMILENYYMSESINKAILLENNSNKPIKGKSTPILSAIGAGSIGQSASSAPITSAQVSNVVDVVFFIIRRSLNRSLFTYNQHTVCAISNYLNQALSIQLRDELFSVLQNKPNPSFPSSTRSGDLLSNFLVCIILIFPVLSERFFILKN